MKRIFITGIKGFLGSSLAQELEQRGYWVTGCSHKPEAVDEKKVFYYDFMCAPPHAALSGVDCVIHCAHDLKSGSMRSVIEGTIQMVEAAMNTKVREQLFISSISAVNPCSEYGHTKSSLEQHFLNGKMRVVRLGLILGNGGLFERMISTIKRFPIVPLVDGGRGQVYFISLQDAVSSIALSLEKPTLGLPTNLYYSEPCSMRALVYGLVKKLRLRRLILDMPWWCVYYPLQLAAAIGLSLPVGLDNLKAYRRNQNLEISSDLPFFVEKPDDLSSVLSRLIV